MRSPRRRKTIQARVVDGVLRVHIPARMSVEEEKRWVAEMVDRMERRTSAARIDLMSRARALARQHGLEVPSSIRWVDNQESRWGSCTPATRTIRISSRLGREPAWVIDYVIVHELAHLSVSGHGPRFWKLVERYPLAERARGFLIARGLESGEPDADADTGAGAPPSAGAGPEGREGGAGRRAGVAGCAGGTGAAGPSPVRTAGAGPGGTGSAGAVAAGPNRAGMGRSGIPGAGRTAAPGRVAAAGGAAGRGGSAGVDRGGSRLPAGSRRRR